MLRSHPPPRYLGIFITIFLLTACGLKGPLRMPNQKPAATDSSTTQSSSTTTRTPNEKKQQPTSQTNTAPGDIVSQPDPAQSPATPPSP